MEYVNTFVVEFVIVFPNIYRDTKTHGACLHLPVSMVFSRAGSTVCALWPLPKTKAETIAAPTWAAGLSLWQLY